jgi:hypothetical protein
VQVRSFMAAFAKRDKVLGPVRGQQPWLMADMRPDVRSPSPATLATEVIPLQRRGPCQLQMGLMACIESDMSSHPQDHGPKPPAANAQQGGSEQSATAVEGARASMLRWFSGVEEADCRHWVETTVVQREPQIVVGIDQHTTRPEPCRIPAEARTQDGGGRCR